VDALRAAVHLQRNRRVRQAADHIGQQLRRQRDRACACHLRSYNDDDADLQVGRADLEVVRPRAGN
jgi:hypothetical protein